MRVWAVVLSLLVVLSMVVSALAIAADTNVRATASPAPALLPPINETSPIAATPSPSPTVAGQPHPAAPITSNCPVASNSGINSWPYVVPLFYDCKANSVHGLGIDLNVVATPAKYYGGTKGVGSESILPYYVNFTWAGSACAIAGGCNTSGGNPYLEPTGVVFAIWFQTSDAIDANFVCQTAVWDAADIDAGTSWWINDGASENDIAAFGSYGWVNITGEHLGPLTNGTWDFRGNLVAGGFYCASMVLYTGTNTPNEQSNPSEGDIRAFITPGILNTNAPDINGNGYGGNTFDFSYLNGSGTFPGTKATLVWDSSVPYYGGSGTPSVHVYVVPEVDGIMPYQTSAVQTLPAFTEGRLQIENDVWEAAGYFVAPTQTINVNWAEGEVTVTGLSYNTFYYATITMGGLMGTTMFRTPPSPPGANYPPQITAFSMTTIGLNGFVTSAVYHNSTKIHYYALQGGSGSSTGSLNGCATQGTLNASGTQTVTQNGTATISFGGGAGNGGWMQTNTYFCLVVIPENATGSGTPWGFAAYSNPYAANTTVPPGLLVLDVSRTTISIEWFAGAAQTQNTITWYSASTANWTAGAACTSNSHVTFTRVSSQIVGINNAPGSETLTIASLTYDKWYCIASQAFGNDRNANLTYAKTLTNPANTGPAISALTVTSANKTAVVTTWTNGASTNDPETVIFNAWELPNAYSTCALGDIANYTVQVVTSLILSGITVTYTFTPVNAHLVSPNTYCFVGQDHNNSYGAGLPEIVQATLNNTTSCPSCGVGWTDLDTYIVIGVAAGAAAIAVVAYELSTRKHGTGRKGRGNGYDGRLGRYT